ncbi:MAG: right-handed parallel beta-helix repeat-containing protein [Bacteroidales bacterium]|nr:right-handed parallel beta-helix repeat-containing protein [Bacteroidales bacterium]
MRSIISIFLIISLFSPDAGAKNYYFSNSIGSDEYTIEQAQNPDTPWKTLDKLNQSMEFINHGDSILFKRGDVFIGQILLTRSGTEQKRIVLSDFGSGTVPVIFGAKTITNWIEIDENIWVADCLHLDTSVTNLFINGLSQQLGRYPNTDLPNKGYLSIESHVGKIGVTNSNLTLMPDWTGGEAVIRTRRWLMERLPILTHSGNSLTFGESASFELIDEFGFFIQNHLGTLDTEGEWFYNSQERKMYLFSTTDPNYQQISATAFPYVFYALKVHHFTLENIEFKGGMSENLYIVASTNFNIKNCIISDAGNNAVVFGDCTNADFVGNSVSRANNNALVFQRIREINVNRNHICLTGLRPGMGLNTNLKYRGITLSGNRIHCEANFVDSIGYLGISFLGDSIHVTKNFVDYFCMTLDDGGGIYTGSEGIEDIDKTIEQNIVINGYGAASGTDNPDFGSAQGIYLDDRSNHVMVINNTIANCSGYGIYIHNSNHFSVIGNTSFNNYSQIAFVHDSHAPDFPITHGIIQNNIFISKEVSQLVATFRTIKNDIGKFGTFDYNYYCRPFEDKLTIGITYVNEFGNNTDLITLNQWQDLYLHDQHSSTSPFELPMYSVQGYHGINKIYNSTFDTDISEWFVWSKFNNGITLWDENELLDNGCLKFHFNFSSGKPVSYMSCDTRCGEIIAGEVYALKLSILSSYPDKKAIVRMPSGENNYDVAKQQLISLNDQRQDFELIFTPDTSDANARVMIIVDEDSTSFWVDNVELYMADIQETRFDDSIVFLYNPSEDILEVHDNDYYIDFRGNKYHNFDLLPYSSLVLRRVTKESFMDQSFPEHSLFLLTYPNPTGSILNVITNYQSNKSITIVDLSGRVFYNERSEADYLSIDIGILPAGPYVITLRGNLGIISARFIVI